jgi:polyisoprenoid-binding protein YceI
MKTFPLASSLACPVALLAAMIVAMPAAAAGKAVQRVQKGEVVVNLPLTVGGSFDARTADCSGELSVDPAQPGKLEGTIAVDLKTLDTGIGLRNQHLRENYLEVDKGSGFDRATLSEIQLEVPDPASFQGKAPFKGTFELHGQKKEVKGEAQIKREGDTAHVVATFPLAISDYQIKKPTYLGVGVKNDIRVKVTFSLGTVATAEKGEGR